MLSQDAVTKLLNVDLDIRGNTCHLEAFLRSIEASVVVLRHADQEASIELAKEFDSLEETMLGLIDLVGALQPETKNIWDRLELRRLNVGIQAASEPYAASFGISAKTIDLIASLGLEIIFTVYAPLAD